MKSFENAQKVCGALFLGIVFAFSMMNIKANGKTILQDVKQLALPQNVAEAKAMISSIENSLNSHIIGKEELIDSYAYIQVLMGKEEIDNFEYIKNKDGGLNYASLYQDDLKDFQSYAKRVYRMQEEVKAKGCKVFFVSPPAMDTRLETEYSAGLPYYDLNPAQDAILYYLNSYGIDCLDLRESLHKKSIPPEQYFFKTDHHWTIETCFASFQAVVEMMDEQYGTNLDPDDFYKDLDHYNKVTYKDSFLGTMGQKAGIPYSGLDDFTLIWPDFETDFYWEAYKIDVGVRSLKGSFADSLVYKNALRTDDPYNTSMYSAYMQGINANVKIVNNRKPEGLKILMVHDSYFVPLAAFMAPLAGEIHMIWPLAGNPPRYIEEYIEENDFDFIIVELYPGNLNEEGFSFFQEETE